jgi:glycosyltransferase involved in cell wall biosynthesis
VITASYVVCNEDVLIAESIRSVKVFVDRFVFVDAVFTTNPLAAMHSTDRTRQVAEQAAYPLPVVYHESDRKMELDEARNLALELVGDHWTLIIDGDETLLGERHEVQALRNAIIGGQVDDPIGVSVFTAMLRFDGHAPAISAEQYGILPVVHTRGLQPRLVKAKGAYWRKVPNGRSYGLYRDEQLLGAPATDALVLVNHRTRQSYAAYQNDYVWETA